MIFKAFFYKFSLEAPVLKYKLVNELKVLLEYRSIKPSTLSGVNTCWSKPVLGFLGSK
jgi:hypothetical protein